MEKEILEMLSKINEKIDKIEHKIDNIEGDIKQIKKYVVDNHQGIRDCMELIIDVGNKTMKIEKQYIKKDETIKLKIVE